MEDNMENKEGARVTRARTRRLSVLDTDSRPGTPQMDMTMERGTASPRSVRRTRLNSNTIDLRTPTRPTRASVARGETPEPTTPNNVSIKRATRTPAKSARKQLPLKVEEEILNEMKEEQQDPDEVILIKSSSSESSPVNVRVTRSMSRTPPAQKIEEKAVEQQVHKMKATQEQEKKEQKMEEIEVFDDEIEASVTKVNKLSTQKLVKEESSIETVVDESFATNLTEAETTNAKEMETKEATKETPSKSTLEIKEFSTGEAAKLRNKTQSATGSEEIIELKINTKTPEKEVKETATNISKDNKLQNTTQAEPKNVEEFAAAGKPNIIIKTPQKMVKETASYDFSKISAEFKQRNNSQATPKKEEIVKETVKDGKLNITNKTPQKILKETPNKATNQVPEEFKVTSKSPGKMEIQAANKSEVKSKTSQILDKETSQSRSTPIKEIIVKETIQTPQKIETANVSEQIKSKTPSQMEIQVSQILFEEKATNKTKTDSFEFKVTSQSPSATKNEIIVKETIQTPQKMEVSAQLKSQTPLKMEIQAVSESKEISTAEKTSKIIKDLAAKDPILKMYPQSTSKIQEMVEEFFKFKPTIKTPQKSNELLDTSMETQVTTETCANVELQDQKLGETPLKLPKTQTEFQQLNKTPQKISSQKEALDSTQNASNQTKPQKLNESANNIILESLEETNNNTSIKNTPQIHAQITEDLRLPNLTPNIMSRVLSSLENPNESVDNKKGVAFTSLQDEDALNKKPIFPKTPGRLKTPSSVLYKVEQSPIKSVSSSTPLGKASAPPLQIDPIKPFNPPMEKIISKSPNIKATKPLISEDEEEEEDNQLEMSVCPFVDNEVEVAADNYQSGDSMDSSLRREMEENEIPCEGESVGSQDTEEPTEDEQSEDDESFIVSDNAPEELDDDIEPLCYSSDDLEVSSHKRRRIIVADSSSNEEEEQPPLEKKPKELSNCSSNASKLSEAAAQLLNDNEPEEEGLDQQEDSIHSRQALLQEMNKSECFNKTASRLEISIEEQQQEDDPKPTPPNKSSLLAELASGDLTHLQPMFNPLQKSRRQSLYMPSPELATKEPKLKRRSERLHDFSPSQSFMEMVAERQQQANKRQRLSKSFCGNIDTLNTEEHKELEQTQETKEKQQLEPEPAPEKEKTSPAKPAPAQLKPTTKPKSVDYYMSYCDSILQAANDAKLAQKKQEKATGKKPQKPARTERDTTKSAAAVPASTAPIAATANTKNKPKKLKKDVKRLQATQQAVKQAVKLLVPELAKEPQSLARKLSPQPPMGTQTNNKNKKKKKVLKKKPEVSSPLKSSDEENQQLQQRNSVIKRLKTNAGYVTVSKGDSPSKDGINYFKIKSGFVQEAPCTPKAKYFREVPVTPQSYFREEPGTPKHSKRGGGQQNPATESALRFKQRVFARKI